MLEVIGSILLVYYFLLGMAALIFLAWGYLDDRRQANRRRRETRTTDDTQAPPGREPEGDPNRQAKQNGYRADNVVGFKRGK